MLPISKQRVTRVCVVRFMQSRFVLKVRRLRQVVGGEGGRGGNVALDSLGLGLARKTLLLSHLDIHFGEPIAGIVKLHSVDDLLD